MLGTIFRKLIFTVLNLLWIWQEIHAILFLIPTCTSLHKTIRWCNNFREYNPSTDTFETCSPAHYFFRQDPSRLPLLLAMTLETIEFTATLQWAGWKKKMLQVDIWTLLLVEGSKIAIWAQYLDRVGLRAEGARENWINQIKLVMEHEAAFEVKFREIEQFSPIASCDPVATLRDVVQSLVNQNNVTALLDLILEGPVRTEMVKNQSSSMREENIRAPPEPPLVDFRFLGFNEVANATNTTLLSLDYKPEIYQYGDIVGYREQYVGLPHPTAMDYWATAFIA